MNDPDTTFDPVLVQQHYPSPIAHAYAKIGTCHTPLHRLYAIRDLTEVTLKYCSILLLQEYLRLGQHAPVADGAIVRAFRRPSLGLWNEVLRETARACASHRGELVVTDLVDLYFDRTGRPRGPAHDLVDQLVAFRNFDAHGALGSDDEMEERVRKYKPLAEKFLASVRFLKEHPLVFIEPGGTCHVHMGIGETASRATPSTSSALETGKLYVIRNGRAVTLFPWLLHGLCGAATPQGPCTLRKTFFFNGGARRKPDFLEYLMAHHKQAADVAELLEELTEHARIEAESADARTRLLPWYILVDKARSFVGRVEEENKILEFMLAESAGYVSIVGDPGIGKSALAAQVVLDLVDQAEPDDWSADIKARALELRRRGLIVACHVCTAKRRETIEIRRVLAALGAQLMQHAASGADPLQENSVEDLVRLAAHVVARQNAKVLLVIDGVDEATNPSQSQSQVIQGLPLDGPLPTGVFVLASSRRGVLPERRDASAASLRVTLQGLSRGEIRYLLGQAGNKYELRDVHLDAIERVSARSPLYVRVLAEDIREGRLTFDDIERLPSGVEGLFENLIERLCVDRRWPAIRDCLLVLAVARDHLTVNQTAAISGRRWAEVQSAMEDALAPVLVEDESTKPYRYQLFHEKFREFVLELFSGDRPGVASRLNRRFVRAATPELGEESEVTAQGHLASARAHLLEYCRRWNAVDDSYPLVHLPALLFEAGAIDELVTLLRDSPFLSAKIKRCGPYVLASDIRYLTLSLLGASRDDDIVELAVTDDVYRINGVAAGLRDAPADFSARVLRIMRLLLKREHERPGAFWHAWARSTRPRRRVFPRILNARRVALEVAYERGESTALLLAADDRRAAVRALLVPYLYRFWRVHRQPGWALLQALSVRLSTYGLPTGRMLDVCGGMSLAILIYHFNDEEITGRLRDQWQTIVSYFVRTPLIRALQRRSVVSVGTSALGLLMARQPDYQPLNLREIRRSYGGSAAAAAAHRDGLDALVCLEHPEVGFEPAIRPVLQRHRPFDVFLMLVVERALVFHGSRDPGAVLAALARVHAEGCRWFQQSVLYVAFHTLYGQDHVETEWLDLYARMTCDTIRSDRATYRTETGEYVLTPHMAWVEAVFEKQHQEGFARFIPTFATEAIALGDAQYIRRVIKACGLLSLAYRRHRLALDALRPLLRVSDPSLRDDVVNVLASVRFHDEDAVDRYLSIERTHDLAQRLTSAAPIVEASNLFTWVDGFMNHSMIHSDTFRTEIARAFRKAGGAQTTTQMFQQITQWVVNLMAGETVIEHPSRAS